MVVYISNDHVKIGIDEKRGGAICYISKSDSNENLVNTWDTGRLIQQSYYGNSDGSKWNGKPWRWNPVQGGSWDNQCSKIICIDKHDDKLQPSISIKCHPRNWGGCELCTDVIMTTQITLEENGDIHVDCLMEYFGDVNHGKSVQEIPACFINPKYTTLVYRLKTTNELVKIIPNGPGIKNIQKKADATWVGYIDPQTNKGIVICSPLATSLTAYRVNISSNPIESNCSYFAPLLDNYSIKKNSKNTYSYVIKLITIE